jgi:hypothetical protein
MLADLQRAFAAELARDGARARIYREHMLAGLCDALAVLFPVCGRLVGDEFFAALARRFARAAPSRSADLNDYGEEFGEFLAGFEPARQLDYLPDVARLEWALHRARCAAPAPPLDPSALARVPESRRGGLRFALAAGASLLISPYPVTRIWEVNQPDYAGDPAVRLDAGAVRLVVARGSEGVVPSELGEAEWLLLEGLARGLSLERAAAHWNRSAESLGALLQRAFAEGWLGGFALD